MKPQRGCGSWCKAFAVASACSILVGCPAEEHPTFLTNDSRGPIRVRYEMPRRMLDSQRLGRCRFEEYPPRYTSERVSGSNWHEADWHILDPAQVDMERCETEFVLPAGQTVWVESQGACSDFNKYEDNPRWRPTVNSLSVSNERGSLALAGFETAKVFKREHDGLCRFRFK